MFTIRNAGGVALFLFGTTFVWLTPAFLTKGIRSDGPLWPVTTAIALVAVAGFSVATYGLFRRASWWETAAIASAVVGVIVLVPYVLAARDAGEPGLGIMVAVHVLGDAGVFALLLIPSLERWVSGHVGAG
jgi:predicted permease